MLKVPNKISDPKLLLRQFKKFPSFLQKKQSFANKENPKSNILPIQKLIIPPEV